MCLVSWSWYGGTDPSVALGSMHALCSSPARWAPLPRAGAECIRAWSPFPPPSHPTCSVPGVLQPLVPGSSNGQAQVCFSSLFLPSQRRAVAGSLHVCRRSGTARLSCRSCLRGSRWQGGLLQDPLWSPLCCSVFLGRAGAACAVLCFSPLCLRETLKTTVAFPAVSAFSIKPISSFPCAFLRSPASISVSLLATVMVLAEPGRTTVKSDVLPQQH